MNSTTLKGFLEQLIPRVNGLVEIHVSDKEGVAIESATANSANPNSNAPGQTAPLFSFCSDQASRTSVGRCKIITASYGDRTIVHVNASPFVITFVLLSSANSNIGLVHALCPEIVRAIQPLSSAVESPNQ